MRGGYAKKKKTRYYHRCFGHRSVNTPPGHESLPRLLARATGSQPDTQESGSLS